jgi:RNA polymerase sigma factor FliA
MKPAAGLDAEERSLWELARGDSGAAARDVLLERHLPYAKIVAATYYGRRHHDGVGFDDYLQLARMGLLEAFERFDPDCGAQFRTFAARRMHGAILDGLSQLTEVQSQLSARKRILSDRTNSLTGHARAEDERGSDPAPPGDQRDAVKARRPTGDLFQYLAQVGMGLALGFMLEESGLFDHAGDRSTGSDPCYAAVEMHQTRHLLRSIVDALPPAERRVIRLHYLQGMLFDQIAVSLQLSKGRVSQLHKQGLASLRSMMVARGSYDQSF